MRRIDFLTGTFATLLLAASGARAATQQPWDKAAFDAAQAAGKPILIAVHAPWCPICAKQRPILAELAADPAFKDMVMMTVDFDSQKPIVVAFGVQKQSTLIVLRGKTEMVRSTGETDAGRIRAQLAKAIV
jgi:thioredoxin 1